MKRLLLALLVFVFCCGFLGLGGSWLEDYGIFDKRELKYVEVVPKLLRALHGNEAEHVTFAANELVKFDEKPEIYDELYKATSEPQALANDEVKWELFAALRTFHKAEFGTEKIDDVISRCFDGFGWEYKIRLLDEIGKSRLYNEKIEKDVVKLVEDIDKHQYTRPQMNFIIAAMNFLLQNNSKKNQSIDKAIIAASTHRHGQVRLSLFTAIAENNYYSPIALQIVENFIVSEREKSVRNEAIAALSKLKILSFSAEKEAAMAAVVTAQPKAAPTVAATPVKTSKKEPVASTQSKSNSRFRNDEATEEYFPKRSDKYNPYGVAVIIGNSTYADKGKNVPDVDYALNDAEAMYQYVTNVLGFRKGNIIYLKDAPQSELVSVFGNEKSHKGRLYNWVRPDVSDVFVFYSGHGAPSLKNGKGYLLPVDSDPGTVELNGYPLEILYENLAKVPAKHKTLIIDACFSGGSQGGSIVKNASSISLRTIDVSKTIPDTNVLTAAGMSEVASWDSEEKHGLFTSYFIKALKGAADEQPYGNGDRRVSLSEIKNYIDMEVPYMARRMYGRDQNPQINGDQNFVFTELTK